MDPIFYTFLGMGIGFIGSQVVMNNFFKNKQNKNRQQNQVTKKYIPSTPDMKKAYQQNQIHSLINRQSDVEDHIRKIVKIQPPPAQFDKDDELSLVQDSEQAKQYQINDSERITQPQTPNFQNKLQTQPNIKLFTNPDQIQKIATYPLILKQNKFSASQNQLPQTTSSESHQESSAENSDQDE
ncbi:unnamed protein product [Paramecium sonneborni]|uniref:Transmembrane protein n=1 Tax=Paramecium sonneborni TaxID=65129 RepID=A0A8S1M9X8_9CILI|nr:unnamed protein product [Paramecium sonneborni]